MSVQVPPIATREWPARETRPLPIRIIPRVDTYPWAIAFVQTNLGKLVLLIAFGLLYSLAAPGAMPLVLCLSLFTWMPSHRHQLLTISMLLFTFVVPWLQFRHPIPTALMILGSLGISVFLIWCASRWPKSWFGRHPIAVLISGFSVTILLASAMPAASPLYGISWDFLMVFATYIWFTGYVLLDRNAAPVTRGGLEIGFLRPFWGSTTTPFPSGVSYLRRIEAQNAGQLAVTQLKGLKLLVWSTLLYFFCEAYKQIIYVHLGFPTLQQALVANARLAPFPWFIGWACTILHFFEAILTLSIYGHRIIACCRMAGFDALRNTYRPFSAVTIAEFFNRYYFYYKEFLVQFFFLPTFLQYSGDRPKRRVVLSIFAAACLGNTFYHFTRDLGYIPVLGLWKAITSFQVFLFYSVVLATAISVSRLRKRNPAPVGFFRGTVCPAFFVALFYCLLDIFANTERNLTLVDHLRFLGHLFFIT